MTPVPHNSLADVYAVGQHYGPAYKTHARTVARCVPRKQKVSLSREREPDLGQRDRLVFLALWPCLIHPFHLRFFLSFSSSFVFFQWGGVTKPLDRPFIYFFFFSPLRYYFYFRYWVFFLPFCWKRTSQTWIPSLSLVSLCFVLLEREREAINERPVQ